MLILKKRNKAAHTQIGRQMIGKVYHIKADKKKAEEMVNSEQKQKKYFLLAI